MTIRSERKRWSVIFTALLNGAKMKFNPQPVIIVATFEQTLQ